MKRTEIIIGLLIHAFVLNNAGPSGDDPYSWDIQPPPKTPYMKCLRTKGLCPQYFENAYVCDKNQTMYKNNCTFKCVFGENAVSEKCEMTKDNCIQLGWLKLYSTDPFITQSPYCSQKGIKYPTDQHAVCELKDSWDQWDMDWTDTPELPQDCGDFPIIDDQGKEIKLCDWNVGQCGMTTTCVSQLDCGIHNLSDISGSCVCACLKGYKNVDNQTCVDVDECSTSPSVCGDENCVNTEGSFTCKETGFFDKPAVKIAGVAIAVVGTVVASVGIASMLTGYFSKASGKANPLQTDGNQQDIDGVNADGLKEAIKKDSSSSSSSNPSTTSVPSKVPVLSSFSLSSASSKTSKVSQTDETKV